MSTTKRLFLGFSIATGLGIAVVVVLTVIAGLDYRRQESQGLHPGYAPEWLATGTYAGILLTVLGLLALAVLGIGVFIRRHNRPPAGPSRR